MLHPIHPIEWETSGASGGGRPWLCIYCRFSSWSFIQIKPMFQPNESFHKWMHWLQQPYYLEMFHSGAAPRLLYFGRTLVSQENTPSLTTHTSDTCDKCVSLFSHPQRCTSYSVPPPRHLTVLSSLPWRRGCRARPPSWWRSGSPERRPPPCSSRGPAGASSRHRWLRITHTHTHTHTHISEVSFHASTLNQTTKHTAVLSTVCPDCNLDCRSYFTSLIISLLFLIFAFVCIVFCILGPPDQTGNMTCIFAFELEKYINK